MANAVGGMPEQDYVLQLIDESIRQFRAEREESWKKSEEQRIITDQKSSSIVRLEDIREKYLAHKKKEGTGY